MDLLMADTVDPFSMKALEISGNHVAKSFLRFRNSAASHHLNYLGFLPFILNKGKMRNTLAPLILVFHVYYGGCMRHLLQLRASLPLRPAYYGS